MNETSRVRFPDSRPDCTTDCGHCKGLTDLIAAAEARGRKAVIGAVLAVHGPRDGWERLWKDPAEALANGWPSCEGCTTSASSRDLAHCPTRKAMKDLEADS